MPIIKFKPKQASKKLLSALSDRSKEVMESRYGLGKNDERMTLEAIGQYYGITRERVRQIENHSIAAIRKSKYYTEENSAFDELESLIRSLGGIIVEQDLLDHISKDTTIQNHINFLLVIGHPFKKIKEDEDFKHRWYVNEELSEKVHGSLKKVYENLKDEDLISETEMIKAFMEHIKDLAENLKNEEMVRRWLSISKRVGKNPLGEWGKTASPNISAKGMRDYAFLVIRKHGSPIHFKEVARIISEVFKKKAHIATCHNELIKDPRFVLVGRGLYALSEWGYMSGVVKDVIRKILEKHGPLSKEEIIDKVMKERYVKENTITVNLQNPKYFKKNKEGKYTVAK
ncbi:MAG: RNA polymerase sigma factor [Parcubacteria group bacterium GW2011_GWA1_40_21]|nr:MAG: RNA polymerase sigma factor [Parcubacteria group bacterium GW2011_GWA1_40_21]